MKSTEYFVKICLVLVVLWSTGDFGFSASLAGLQNHENNFQKKFVKFDWICTTNTTCTAEHSFCNEQKKCQCPSDWVFNAALTACLEVATAYGDKCEETSQCVAYLQAGGTCTDKACNCVTGFHYLHGRCIKSSGLGEKCQNDDECYANADHEALSCVDGVCRCSNGFYQREYRTCRREAKAIGAECTVDLDCTFDENARCDRKLGCYIKSGNNTKDKLAEYENSGNRLIRALDEDGLVGGRCTATSDCSDLGSAICTETGYCICERGYSFNSKMDKCISDIGEKCELNDSVVIKESKCRDGRWSCQGARVSSASNRLCRKVTRSYNSSCQFNEQCYVFGPDALCMEKKCVCSENSHYFAEQMFCWINRGINDNCERDEDCFVEGFRSKLICSKSSKCDCPVGTHVNNAKTACINDVPALGDFCSDNGDCTLLNNSKCVNESCACANNYFDLSGVCVAGINAICDENAEDCKTKNSTCVSNICQCADDLVSPASDLCIAASEFGGECQYDIQCSATVKDAHCFQPEVAKPDESAIGELNSKIGTCDCDAGHHQRYERCHRSKVLDEKCTSRGECYVRSDPDSVYCLKGLCTCDVDAKRINSTFCETDANATYVFSSWLLLIIFLVVELA